MILSLTQFFASYKHCPHKYLYGNTQTCGNKIRPDLYVVTCPIQNIEAFEEPCFSSNICYQIFFNTCITTMITLTKYCLPLLRTQTVTIISYHQHVWFVLVCNPGPPGYDVPLIIAPPSVFYQRFCCCNSYHQVQMEIYKTHLLTYIRCLICN